MKLIEPILLVGLGLVLVVVPWILGPEIEPWSVDAIAFWLANTVALASVALGARVTIAGAGRLSEAAAWTCFGVSYGASAIAMARLPVFDDGPWDTVVFIVGTGAFLIGSAGLSGLLTQAQLQPWYRRRGEDAVVPGLSSYLGLPKSGFVMGRSAAGVVALSGLVGLVLAIQGWAIGGPIMRAAAIGGMLLGALILVHAVVYMMSAATDLDPNAIDTFNWLDTLPKAAGAAFIVVGLPGVAADIALGLFPSLESGLALLMLAVWNSRLPIVVSLGVATLVLFFATHLTTQVDPRLTLSKGAATSLLIGIGFAAVPFVEGLISDKLSLVFGFPTSAGTWVAGGLVALSLAPFRGRLENQLKGMDQRPDVPTALQEQPRGIRTVLFADIVGYSRLMARDEDAGLRLADRFVRLATAAAARCRGEVIKTSGDAVFCAFLSPCDACEFAVDFSASLKSPADQADTDPPVQIRVGAAEGEVVVADQGDIFGHTVNIAARLEAAAPIQALLVTKDLAERCRSFDWGVIEAISLKNIPDAVETSALSL